MTVDGKAKPVHQEDPNGVGSVDETLAARALAVGE